MRPTDKISTLIEKLKLNASADLDNKIDNAISKALTEQKKTTSAATQPNIWRIIMSNVKIRKVAIAMIICVVILGIVPLKGTTAFGLIANGVTTTLSRLKALVLGEELPATEHPLVGRHRLRSQQIDNSEKILTNNIVYSSPDISSLEHFLNKQDIDFISADSGTAKYAIISADEIVALHEFLESSESYKILTTPTIITNPGGEAMIAIDKTVGVAITVLKDKNEHLNLDFAIHNGQDGCEISGVKLAKGEALLISGIEIRQNESSDAIMTALVLPEVIQD